MKKLPISTALSGILAALLMAGAPAFAQDHHDDHRGGGPQQGGHAGPPGGRQGGPGPAMRGPGGPGPQHNGPQHANAPGQNGRMAGPRPGPAMARPGGQHRDFGAMHRNFNAPHRFRAPAYRQPAGWYARRWTFGETLPAQFWVRDYWLDDFSDFGLSPPPPGTVWVRYGDDALLIDQYDGQIIQVEYGVFY